MSEKGTVIINKLEQTQIAHQFNNKCYFTDSESNKMKQHNPQKYQLLQNLDNQYLLYVVSDGNDFVLAGTLGEMWTI